VAIVGSGCGVPRSVGLGRGVGDGLALADGVAWGAVDPLAGALTIAVIRLVSAMPPSINCLYTIAFLYPPNGRTERNSSSRIRSGRDARSPLGAFGFGGNRHGVPQRRHDERDFHFAAQRRALTERFAFGEPRCDDDAISGTLVDAHGKPVGITDAGSYADPDAFTASHTDTDAFAASHADADPASDADRFTNADSDADTDAHGITDAHADAHADADTHADGFTNANANADAYSDRNAHPDADADVTR
jgi:hypothetical protein